MDFVVRTPKAGVGATVLRPLTQEGLDWFRAAYAGEAFQVRGGQLKAPRSHVLRVASDASRDGLSVGIERF